MKAIIKIILPSIPIVCLGQQKVCVYNDDEVLGNDTKNKTANNVFQEDYKLPNFSAYLGDKTEVFTQSFVEIRVNSWLMLRHELAQIPQMLINVLLLLGYKFSGVTLLVLRNR